MSLHRPVVRHARQRQCAVDESVRLDQTRNPYGPSPAATEALEMRLESLPQSLLATIRSQLSSVHRVPTGSIHLLRDVDAAIHDIATRHEGPLIAFPPSAPATLVAGCCRQTELVSITRGPGSDAGIGPDVASDIPANGLAVIDSPSDPLGSVVSPADVVRLSRACAYVVVDERFAEFSGFSLLPLALELDNLVVLRSFESWAGLPDPSCAWAVAPPRLADQLELARADVEPGAIAGAIGTLNDRAAVVATLQLVREERSRLFRFLRRLSFLEPLPSWAPFLTARVTIVPRQDLTDGLMRRGIHVHAPGQPGLEEYVRIGIGPRTAMERLRAALLELGPELVG